MLVTDAVSGPAVSALLTRSDLTSLRYPLVESLYSRRGAGSSGVRVHAVYIIAPEHRARLVEDCCSGKVDHAASEAWLLKDMRPYASPEQFVEAVSQAVKADILPAQAERCVGPCLPGTTHRFHWLCEGCTVCYAARLELVEGQPCVCVASPQPFSLCPVVCPLYPPPHTVDPPPAEPSKTSRRWTW